MGRLILIQDFRGGGWMRFRAHQVWSLGDGGQEPAVPLRNSSPERSDILSRLEEAEARVEADRCWAVLFLTFECASAFDQALAVTAGGPLPALWIAFCDEPERLDWNQVRPLLHAPSPHHDSKPARRGHRARVGIEWKPDWDLEQYRQRVSAVQRAIRDGDAYQVNLTFSMRTAFEGSPRGLFADMAEAQKASCSAYLETDEWALCSASPELFLWRQGKRILTRPMKGTASRGRTLAEDQRQSQWLARSEKNRAENLMIADMMRNDLGRLAETGSVQVERLFQTERYPTLWQMTSSVTARSQAPTSRVLAAAFPPASTTGAPKVAACRLISRLEDAPRGVYTGCIGYLAPARRAQFNVAIRTVTVDRRCSQAVYGVGSGIVADSDADAEYRECLLKAQVLTQPPPDFQLLETLLWRRGKIFLLEEHLSRLRDSARYFAFPLSLSRVLEALHDACAGLEGQGSCPPHRLRLLVDRGGRTSVEATALEAKELKRPLTLGLAAEPVDSSDPFLFHKTTRRGVYERALASRPDCDDVILYNEKGEVTETALGNLLLRRDSGWVTPPLECGLLAGTLRARLLARGTVCQDRLRVDDLRRGPSLLRLINSVRGIVRVARIQGRKGQLP